MKRHLVAFVLGLAVLRSIPAQTADAHRFQVRVLNSLTGAGVEGAAVVLSKSSGVVAWGKTNAAGTFDGHAPAGRYYLNVTRKGYRPSESGAFNRPVEIQPGAESTTTVKMLQSGIIAGRVLDQFGDPVRDALVRTLDKMSDRALNEYYESLNATRTDDRGEYRITGVEPGRHYIAAEFDSQNRFPPSRFHWPDTNGWVLYPDATDIQDAVQVEAAPGQVSRLKDLRLKIQRALVIAGHVTPVPKDTASTVSIQRAGPNLGLNLFAVHSSSTDADGTFKISAFPGRYTLSASDQETGRISQKLSIDVRDKDIADVELKLDTGYEISGRILIDGSDQVDFSKLTLTLLGPNAKIGADGTFHAHLFSEKASYALFGLPQGWYIQDVRLNGQHVAEPVFEVQPGTSELSILLNPRGARLEVRVDAAGDALQTAFVALLPDRQVPPDLNSIPRGTRDAPGTFSFQALPPGPYRVFALDASNLFMLLRPDQFMAKFGKDAPLVTLAEAERKSIVVALTKIRPE
jgi:hypothetical protein